MSGTSSKSSPSAPDTRLDRVEHLRRRALSAHDRALQVALEVLRRVLAREVTGARHLGLGAAEARVLAGLVVRVGAAGPRVRGPEVDRGAAVPLARDAGEHGLDLREELLRPRGRRAAAEGRADLAARVVDEDPRGAGLRPGDLPRRLVARVGVGVAVVAEAAPVRVLKPTLSFELVPMGSSRMARVLRVSKPAFEKSTERSIENGSASTTRSAVTVCVAVPCWKVSA